MWMALLAKLLIEVVPKVLDKILKGDRQGLVAADTKKEVAAVRSGLVEAMAMLDKGE